MSEWLIMFAIIVILIVISWIDIRTMTIPNSLLLILMIPITVVMLRGTFMGSMHTLTERILGFFVISLPMYLVALIKPSAFGGGDIKLIAVCGLLLGWKQTLMAALLSILFGGIYALLFWFYQN